jgi:protein transport protein SEC61 subunit gamma-like protein
VDAALGVASSLKSWIRVLKLAKKPGRTELWLSIKICALGITVIGVIAFIIKFISAALQGFAG